MGTRNLTMVVADEKTVVAQYGQWDGYFAGQGRTILEFLKRPDFDIGKFKKELATFRFMKEGDEADEAFVEKINNTPNWPSVYPHISRDAGADILNMIYDGTVPKEDRFLSDSSNFAADSLFCEYAYVIDLDNEVLECYCGFNEKGVAEGERFSELDYEVAHRGDNQYYPIRLFTTITFDKIRTTDADELIGSWNARQEAEYEAENG